MKPALYFLLIITSHLVHASEIKSGYYLKWDTDHTERNIRPAYPINADDINQYNVYRIDLVNQKPKSVCYFASGQPSNKSNFGAHCLNFTYQKDNISRSFFNIDGEQVNNNQGVYTVKYMLDKQKHASKKQNLDSINQLVEDKSGSAEYYFKRDEAGRRYSEIRRDAKGQVVPEHNGFYEARFEFDANDYATYRRGFGPNGKVMEGKYGYATAHFWFDKNGTFEQEEFRNAAGQLVLGPSETFAKIDYKDIDRFGNWHKVNLYDASGKLLTGSAAILIATYNKNATRKSMSYFSSDMQPAENARGISQYVYTYDDSGDFVERKGYSLKGEQVE